MQHTPNELYEKLGYPKDFLDFHTFVKTADWESYRIQDCFVRSIEAKEIDYINPTHIDALVDKKAYVLWAAKKGFPLPSFMTEDVEPWSPPPLEKVRDVEKLNWENLPFPILAAIGANVIAQLYRRIDIKTQQGQIYRSKPMNSLLDLLQKAEKTKNPKKEDTIREYIENQYK